MSVHHSFKSGFTLSELLIALALLGLIASFTIPKVLNSTTGQVDKAKWKESIAVIQEVSYNAYSQGLTDGFGADSIDFLRTGVNASNWCNPVMSSPCWDSTATPEVDGGNADMQIGFLMPNGAVAYGLDTGPTVIGDAVLVEIVIDINGPEGPNLEGTDEMVLVANFGTGASNGVAPGVVRPPDYRPASASLFLEVFN